jgi:hypothetical protein
MSPRETRRYLSDGSFVDRVLESIKPDRWRPHGVRYRYAWIQNGECRVLFDNHHGKGDHLHIDGEEKPYKFSDHGQLLDDFYSEIRKLGGAI